jgi:DNA-binding MarR family transcriptional regulator
MAKAARWLDETEMQTWLNWLLSSSLLREKLDAELTAEHQLSLAEYEVLAQLSQSPGERARMSELAQLAVVSKSRLTHLVDRMVERGFVERERCPNDRRGLFAVLTPAGKKVLRTAAPSHVESVRRYLIDVLDRSELQTLGCALGRVVDGLSDGARPPAAG